MLQAWHDVTSAFGSSTASLGYRTNSGKKRSKYVRFQPALRWSELTARHRQSSEPPKTCSGEFSQALLTLTAPPCPTSRPGIRSASLNACSVQFSSILLRVCSVSQSWIHPDQHNLTVSTAESTVMVLTISFLTEAKEGGLRHLGSSIELQAVGHYCLLRLRGISIFKT